MSPQQYKDKYFPVSWSYAGSDYKADIKQYLAMSTAICDASKIGGAKKALRWILEFARTSLVTDWHGSLFIAEEKQGGTFTVKQDQLERSFHGKGSPGDISTTLKFATHLSLITDDSAKLDNITARPQNFADWYLGMDCSGFAMNYLGLSCEIHDLDDSHQPERRQGLKDIKANDVLISRKGGDYNHIALVTSAAMQGTACRVNTVEAYGPHLEGVSNHYRDFEVKSPGIFQERQGAKVITSHEYYFQPVPQRGGPKV